MLCHFTLYNQITNILSHFTITLSPHYTYTIGLAYNMDGLKDITWGQFKLYSCFALGFIMHHIAFTILSWGWYLSIKFNFITTASHGRDLSISLLCSWS